MDDAELLNVWPRLRAEFVTLQAGNMTFLFLCKWNVWRNKKIDLSLPTVVNNLMGLLQHYLSVICSE